MATLEEWRRTIHNQIDEEWEELEEADRFWELVMSTEPQSCTTRRQTRKHGGSRPGRKGNKKKKREEGHQKIWDDYFSEDPVYSAQDFRRRYRMTRKLFDKIMADVCRHDPYFVQKRDAAGLNGLSPIQKLTAALRQLALGICGDATDEYCRLGESTTLKCLYRFVTAIRELYEAQYLKRPGPVDFEKQLQINADRGFPGMFGSLDCMHYVWKNCPVAWQGQFTDKDGEKSIILEAVADQELWIWHAFFGLPGGNNDLNVLDRSPLVNEWLHNASDQVKFSVNGREYQRAYLLVDSIYPKWSILISTIHMPQTDKKAHFAKCQEAARKDVERAFGVLQARWAIARNPARSWSLDNISNILMACVILHNMIIEDERGERWENLSLGAQRVPLRRTPMPWRDYLKTTATIESEVLHFQLQNDIIDHLWSELGESRNRRRALGLIG